ncbi:glycosyltransferase family 2 protein [uncultured Psychroserpens sp.]|uniref:glycosyltransferase n=1 Tax=uncultured Psychroserpens sp. TaxID=255436 RepID=UPI002639FD97|nr:glycosyltransferase family 2 protein [uncultured Psychroserpens sp.]
MDFYIVISAHNEEGFIAKTLQSLVKQTLLPKRVVVVNDNSTDATKTIVEDFTSKYSWISLINITSKNEHLPGSKVINAFYKGFETLDSNYHIICKFDADIVLPNNYLERLKVIFESDKIIGIAGGLAYVKENDQWVYENISNKDHVRGPFKAYSKKCFEQIGGLKPTIGWDTVDTLLARYYGWKVVTDKELHVKHLKPTGENYNENSKYFQGEALYKMRYGFMITLLTAIKMAYNKQRLAILKNYLKGYFRAKRNNIAPVVTVNQGKFIRQYRWKGILGKLN